MNEKIYDNKKAALEEFVIKISDINHKIKDTGFAVKKNPASMK